MVKIEGGKFFGDVRAISSKSQAHRALICASGAFGQSKIYLKDLSQDIKATILCLEELGAGIRRDGEFLYLDPIKKCKKVPILDVNESGSSLRFLLPLATSLYEETLFILRGRLAKRPLDDLIRVLEEGGVKISRDGDHLRTRGFFKSGYYKVPGNVSSQYLTGLLMTGPFFEEGIAVEIEGDLESKPYVDLTLKVMEDFGIGVKNRDYKFFMVEGGKKYEARYYEIEGDWSNASYFLLAGALGGPVVVRGLSIDSTQGDKEIINILKDFGAKVSMGSGAIRVEKGEGKPIKVDLSQIPDSLPALAILSCGAHGKSYFYNGKRLRYKESDRIESTKNMVEDLGGRVEEREDGLIVEGQGRLKGGELDSFNDHRIVMAASIASSISEGPVYIKNHQAVNKSYPDFFQDMEKLGAKINFQEEG